MADDDVLSNTTLREIIETGGNYKVNPFFNGLDLCNFYEEKGENISFVLLDVEMPERNGIDTAQWIRNYEISKHRKRVPIIGLTGHTDQQIIEKCLCAGMDKILKKPIRKVDILETLKSFI